MARALTATPGATPPAQGGTWWDGALGAFDRWLDYKANEREADKPTAWIPAPWDLWGGSSGGGSQGGGSKLPSAVWLAGGALLLVLVLRK